MKTGIESDDFDLAADGIAAVQKAFLNGKPIDEAIRKKNLWERAHILIVLPFELTQEMIKINMGIGNYEPEDNSSIERIYIYPSESEDSDIQVIMGDNRLEHLFGFTIEASSEKMLNSALLRYMNSIRQGNYLTYISTMQNEEPFYMFQEDQLLPVNGQSYDLLETLYGSTFFISNGEWQEEELKGFASYFFTNPDNNWKTEYSQLIRFGDLEAIVSYTKKGVFTYQLIEDLENKKTSLFSAYETLEDFLEKDTLLSQLEYRLDKYEMTDKGITFYFRYQNRGVPIIFKEGFDSINYGYPMELTVKGSTVVEYKRVLWKNQDVIKQGNPFEVLFQNPIDDFMEEFSSGDVQIKNIYLIYYVSESEDGGSLKWAVDLSNGERRYYELE